MNHHPVIYLRPTFDYTNRDTYYEAEQIVMRTISLDDNWRNSNPKVINRMLFETYFEILDMSLLPGGKYLVASMKDKCGFHHYVTLYIMDHPSGPKAIARYKTEARAFHLQTKYMKINGEFVIVTTCVQRRWKNGKALRFVLFPLFSLVTQYPYIHLASISQNSARTTRSMSAPRTTTQKLWSSSLLSPPLNIFATQPLPGAQTSMFVGAVRSRKSHSISKTAGKFKRIVSSIWSCSTMMGSHG
jgi:hypothetical protein